ncbi:FA78A-like protein [Mya arenaria]|uniref:FA78A-like protein n=1 Tax=Mya arenaria TaxID=6604 RepID=A0ABY7GBF4_MYAAR|nr:FA78A-like protein [Mya arenaria]WAR31838.1 FA78A-like protein [Mya arenaria]
MAHKGDKDQEMGNINRVVIKPGHLKEIHQKVRVLNFRTLIDNLPTSIDESSSTVLKASATVEMAPLSEQHKWKIGWIQACTDMTFHNTYSDEGYTSWEFPELSSGTQNMISDCDGHHYPWYGSRNETVTFEGPCKMYQTATVTMNDNFHPHTFNVWLVVWNMTTQKAYILKNIRWNMQLNIDVDPSKPLGQRAKLMSNPVPRQPEVLEHHVPIPKCALMPPNANSAQMLVWRPRVGQPMCIIPPVWKKDVPIDKQVPRYDSKLTKL